MDRCKTSKSLKLRRRTNVVAHFILCLVCSSIFSQISQGVDSPELKFDRLTLLEDESIELLYQDSTGLLWIGTWEGLYRYDGQNVTRYFADPHDEKSISGNMILTLTEDHEGCLWIGTNTEGLNRYDPSTNSFQHFKHNPDDPNSLSMDKVTEVFEDSSHRLWVGTWGGGLNLLDWDSMTFKHYNHTPNDLNSLTGNSVYDFVEDQDANVWVGTDKGICRYNSEQDHFDTVPAIRRDITSLSMDREGNLWGGAWTHATIYRVNCKTMQCELTKENRNFGGITDMLIDSKNRLWCGFNALGLGCFDVTRMDSVIYKHNRSDPWSLSDDNVTSIFEDRSGVLWIGTNKGLNKLVPHKQVFHGIDSTPGKKNKLSFERVQSLYQNADGLIWIGTLRGLNCLDPKTNQITQIKKDFEGQIDFSSLNIRSIHGAPDGCLSIASTSELILFDPRTKQVKQYPYAANILLYDDHGILWMGTHQGLMRFNVRTEKMELIHPSDNSSDYLMVTTLVKNREGKIWFGAENGGLHRYDPKQGSFENFLHDPKDPNSLSSNDVISLKINQDGTLLVSTSSGLNCYDETTNRFTRLTNEKNLGERRIRAAIQDEGGYFWISAMKGLHKFDPRTGDALVYRSKDGLLNDGFNSNVFLAAQDGQFFFGGGNGLDFFRPEDVCINQTIPPIVFTSITSQGKDLSIAMNSAQSYVANLPYSKNSLSVEYIALDYTAPEKNRYRTFLEGADSVWRETSRTAREFIHLPPGEYTFYVTASNNDGIWNKESIQFYFRISPPYWMTWWFRSLVGICCVLLLIFIYYLRVRHIKKDHQRLALEVKNRTATLHAAQADLLIQKDRAESATQAKSRFLARMSHEIRTPLNGIIGNLELLSLTKNTPQETNLLNLANVAAQTLLGIIGDVLDFAKIEANKLEFEYVEMSPRHIVEEVFSMMCIKAHQRNINMVADIDPQLPQIVLGDPVRIRQVLINLIGNSIKFTQIGCVYISVNSSSIQSNIVDIEFEILDTGVGFSKDSNDLFEEFVQEDSRSIGVEGTGLGLAICKRFVDLMGGKIGCEGHKGYGAKFWFTLPLAVHQQAELVPVGQTKSLRVAIINTSKDESCNWLTDILSKHEIQYCEISTMQNDLLQDTPASNEFDFVFMISSGEEAPYDSIHPAGSDSKTSKVLLSSSNDPLLSFTARRMGFDFVLQPPFGEEQILRVIYSKSQLALIQDHITDQKGNLKQAINYFGAHPLSHPVLVVDDTHTNRILAQNQLTELGLQCELAIDGSQALEYAKENQYTLILADCSMPVMDGFEFTRQLRLWESAQNKHTPVIAMTAHVVSGDEERCIQAGMDDYLPKPVKINRLAELLLKWLTSDNDQQQVVQDDGSLSDQSIYPSLNENELALINLQSLQEEIGVENSEILHELLQAFIEDIEKHFSLFSQAMEVNDRIDMKNQAHAAKSAAKSTEAEALDNVLQDLENQSLEADTGTIKTLFRRAQEEYEKVKQWIHFYIKDE